MTTDQTTDLVDPDVAAEEQQHRDMQIAVVRRAVHGTIALIENVEAAIYSIDEVEEDLGPHLGEDPPMPSLDEPWDDPHKHALDLPDFVHHTLMHQGNPLRDYRAALLLQKDGLERHLASIFEAAEAEGIEHYDVYPEQAQRALPFHLKNVEERLNEKALPGWRLAVEDARRRAGESPAGYAFIEPASLYGDYTHFPIWADSAPADA